MAYGNGLWVAGGYEIFYSTNGVDWIGEGNFYGPFKGVAYANGSFVAGGEGTWALLASTNGINWRLRYSLRETVPFLTPQVLNVAYGNGSFVAGGSGSSFLVAANSDLASAPWEWGTPSYSGFRCYGLVFAGGKFVATGSTSNAATATSTNGRDWTTTPHPSIGPVALRGVTWHNGKFIVVGDRGVILISADGENWTQRASSTTKYLFRVAAHENQYVAVGDRVMLISTNGLDWEEIPLVEPATSFTDLIVADDSFVAVGTVSAFSPYTIIYRSSPFYYTAPSIQRQPAHAEQRIGLTTNLTARFYGSGPLAYQWQRNGVDIPGATSNELIFPKLERTDDARYRVIARNSLGEAVSDEAVLTVGLPVKVLVSPVSQSVPAGGSATFSMAIEGTPPVTNRWRTPGPTFVTQILNQATAFLQVDSIQPANAGTYGATLANKYGLTASLAATLTVLTDADADGLPDDWETQYGVTDPAADSDGDTLTNLQEYQAGTDPKDGQSYLKVQRIETAPGAAAVILTFIARSNHTYTVQSREYIGSGTWQRVLDVVASSADRVVTVTNGLAANENYFRLATPRVE